MDAYADRHPFADDDFTIFTYYLGELDDKLLELVKNKAPKPGAKPPQNEGMG